MTSPLTHSPACRLAQGAVEHFDAIEGLRAWLAWGVVVGHVFLFAGLSRLGVPERAGDIASDCVQVFIIVSGFVIAHLLLSRSEGYLSYVARRFFRLFPAYVLCVAFGAAAIALSRTPWPGDPAYQYGQQLVALKEAQAQHFTANLLLHLAMLHGAVPNNILNVSQWALLPVAWGVSLEWQFYLLAPALLLLLQRTAGAAVVVVLTAAGVWAYGRGDLGGFESPSFLPAAAEFFLLGIGSRLFWLEFTPTRPAALIVPVIAVGVLIGQVPIASWLAFASYLYCRRDALKGVDAALVTTADRMFNSRIAHWAGKRTYCVYLVHFPIYQLVLTALTSAGVTSPLHVAGLLLLFGFPLTGLLAEALHRWIELPGIQFGKGVAGHLHHGLRNVRGSRPVLVRTLGVNRLVGRSCQTRVE